MSSPIFTLIPELIPEPLWGKHLAGPKSGACSRSLWRRIKRNVSSFYEDKCSYCGCKKSDESRPRESELFCHEVWSYNETAHIQILVDFRTACVNCSDVLHLGRLNALLEQGLVTRERHEEVIKHLRKVNGITLSIQEELYEAELASLFLLHEKRSSHRKWKQDTSRLDSLLEKYGVVTELRTEEKFKEIEKLVGRGLSQEDAIRRVSSC